MRFAIISAALALFVANALAQDSTLHGSWRLENPDRVTARRDAAVGRAVADMNALIRGIARRRLTEGAPVHRSLEIQINGNRVHATVGPYDLDCVADGTSVPFTDPTGDEEIRAKQIFRSGVLRQIYFGPNGRLEHILRLDESGDRLHLTVKITSPRLPGDAIYRATYRRVP